MSGASIQWPRKIRELRSVKFDSAEKAGAAEIDVQAISPWLDLRLPPLAAKLAADYEAAARSRSEAAVWTGSPLARRIARDFVS